MTQPTPTPNPGPRKPTLVTGNAGFIGFHVARRLLEEGTPVVGFDNVNDYYDPALKDARLQILDETGAETGTPYEFIRADLTDRQAVERLFADHRPARVIHLAAQAGVRYAAENPHVYVQSNVTGTLHVLEGCRQHPVEHLVFASTSSVYGANPRLPFAEDQATEHPLTLYAATKKATEMMAHSYAHLYAIPATGLRFFTVYGPWGRPDMALFKFTRAILAGEPIQVYNHGRHTRSFSYIDDVVEGVIQILEKPPQPTDEPSKRPNPAASPVAPYRILNIGNPERVELKHYIEVLEKTLGRKAEMEMLPLQPGDVPDTESDVSSLEVLTSQRPQVTVEEGIAEFVRWYRDHYETLRGTS